MKKLVITIMIVTGICAILNTENALATEPKKGKLVIDCYLHDVLIGTTDAISFFDTRDYIVTCFNALSTYEVHSTPLDPHDTHPSLPRCFRGKPSTLPGG